MSLSGWLAFFDESKVGIRGKTKFVRSKEVMIDLDEEHLVFSEQKIVAGILRDNQSRL